MNGLQPISARQPLDREAWIGAGALFEIWQFGCGEWRIVRWFGPASSYYEALAGRDRLPCPPSWRGSLIDFFCFIDEHDGDVVFDFV